MAGNIYHNPPSGLRQAKLLYVVDVELRGQNRFDMEFCCHLVDKMGKTVSGEVQSQNERTNTIAHIEE